MTLHNNIGGCAFRLADWLQDFEDFSGVEFPLAAYYFSQSASKCVCGVSESAAPLLTRLVAFSIIQRFLWSFGIQQPFVSKLIDIIVGLLGVALSWQNRGSTEAVVTIFVYFLLSTSIIFLLKKYGFSWTGHLCAILTFIYMIFCQLYVFDAITFTSLYGSMMIAAMKLISLAYDSQSWKQEGGDELARFFVIFAFVFNPATFSFGPFFNFSEFMAARQHAHRFYRLNWRTIILNFFLILRFLFTSFVFLLASQCFAEQMPYLIFGPESTFLNIFPLFPDYAVEFALGYAEAQSFRFNHYFVCYLSDGLTALAGLRFMGGEREKKLPHRTTTNWRAIEWPKSMSTAVVEWNLPTHSFLHNYIFQQTRDVLGYFFAMSFTFAVSALLHGFNFQLNAVLFSLAFYGFVESDLRYKLSGYFSACVKSRNCRKHCEHRFKSRNLFVMLTNLAFTLLNIYHLAYLGAPFAASTTEAEVGFHWRHTLNVWSQWNFSSHSIAIIMFIFSRIV